MAKKTTKEFQIFKKTVIEEDSATGKKAKSIDKKVFPSSNKNSNILKNVSFWIWVAVITILVPFIINSIFHIPALLEFFEGKFEAPDLLSFEGTVIAAFILFITVKLTIESNYKKQTISNIDSSIKDFLKLLETRKGEEIILQNTTAEKEEKAYELMDSIEEKYIELCISLPPLQRKQFENDVKPDISQLKFKINQITQFYDLHLENNQNNKNAIDTYENKEIPSLNAYLEEVNKKVSESYYSIRQSMII